MAVLETEYRWVEGSGAAFGAPGLQGRWTSAAKDTVGTAYSASSRVWYTVSHGILNEVYFPTIDRPQIRDMEFLISDGETYFQEEKRNLKTKFEYIDSDSPAVRTIGPRSGGPVHADQGDHLQSPSSGGDYSCGAGGR